MDAMNRRQALKAVGGAVAAVAGVGTLAKAGEVYCSPVRCPLVPKLTVVPYVSPLTLKDALDGIILVWDESLPGYRGERNGWVVTITPAC